METKTESQALQKEIGELREEIALLRKEVADNSATFVKLLSNPNLTMSINSLVGIQTAEFIINNLNKAPVLIGMRKYFSYLLNNSVTDMRGGVIFGIRRLQRQQYQHPFGDKA